MPQLTITLRLFTCLRCHHQWWPSRDPNIVPKRCPGCASYDWHRERVRKPRAEMLASHKDKLKTA